MTFDKGTLTKTARSRWDFLRVCSARILFSILYFKAGRSARVYKSQWRFELSSLWRSVKRFRAMRLRWSKMEKKKRIIDWHFGALSRRTSRKAARTVAFYGDTSLPRASHKHRRMHFAGLFKKEFISKLIEYPLKWKLTNDGKKRDLIRRAFLYFRDRNRWRIMKIGRAVRIISPFTISGIKNIGNFFSLLFFRGYLWWRMRCPAIFTLKSMSAR